MTADVIRIKRRTKSGDAASAYLRDAVGADPPSSKVRRELNFTGTDDWAGERLAEHLKGKAYWSDREATWIWWDGKRWTTGADSLLIHEATISAKKLAVEGIEGDSRDVLATVKRRLSAGGAEAALKMARSRLRGDKVVWNPDPHLLNCQNGIVNLKTGDRTPHDPDRHMTLITSCDYDPTQPIPQFLATLKRFQPDAAVREYLHRQYGYRATGEVGERAFFCQLGEGSNGKSTIENMIAKALGDYHAIASPGLFLQPIHSAIAKEASGHTEALYRLRYKRNVLLREPDNTVRLDEMLIKAMTDGVGSTFTSRTLHRESVTDPVTQKLVFYSNNPPRMSAARSIANRLHAVVWGETVSKEDENPNFPQIFLVPELAGILAWIVQGAMKFYAEEAKLGRPAFLQAGEEEYRKGSDPLGDFISENVMRAGRGLPFRGFYERYCAFCEKKGAKPTGANYMTKALASHGLTVKLFTSDSRHPLTGARLDNELRWVTDVEWVG